jgi:ankyrin
LREADVNARTVIGCAALLAVCAGAGLSAGAWQGPAAPAPPTVVVGRQTVRSDVADAAMRGNKARLRELLKTKSNVNAPQVDGSTALHWAVYRDDVEMVDLLLTAGAQVAPVTREGITPLAMASMQGSLPIIERLLKAGADAKALGPNGETMLMFAARNGSPAAIRTLVAAGANVNAREAVRGTTALMWAAEQRHPEAVKTLLELGGDPHIKSGPAGLPRNYMANRVNVRTVEQARLRRERAAQAGRTYEEQLAFEQKQGMAPPPRVPAAEGVVAGQPQPAAAPAPTPAPAPAPAPAPTPAPAAAPTSPPAPGAAAAAAAAAAEDNEIVVAGLVGSGGGGLTPLVFAAREGDVETAKVLLDAGADVNLTTEYGWTPLLTAVNNRNYRVAQLLIERGADVNLANKGGWTPLYLATDNRNIEGGDYPVPKADLDHLEIIRLMLEKGARPDTRVKDNTLTRTIFTMQWFFEDGATAFIRAAQSGDTELMSLLLKYGADPKAVTANGDNALTAAAGIGWVEGVTYERSVKENLEAIRMLLDLGVDPNHANNEGRTPLMGAALKGRSDVVQLLVDRGADLAAKDKGSRDTDKVGSVAAGHMWQAIDYADGLVRVGVQSAIERPETSALIRKLMTERNLPVPPADRNINSICVVALCQGLP